MIFISSIFRFVAAVLIASLIPVCLPAQTEEGEEVGDADSTASVKPNLRPEIAVRAWFTFSPPNSGSLQAREPEEIARLVETDERRVRNWGTDFYSIIDNPLFHGAASVEVDALFRPWPGLSLLVGVTGENRGISYGVGNTESSVVIPRYQFRVDTGFSLFGQDFRVSAAAGDFRRSTIDEGLFFRDADVEGGEILLSWKNLRYRYRKVGDAFAGVGLNIDDADFYSLEYVDLPLPFDLTGGVRLHAHAFNGIFPFDSFEGSPRQLLLDSVGPTEIGAGLSGYLAAHDSLFRLYSQLAVRGSEENIHLMSRTAFLAGVSVRTAGERFSLDARAEYRYFGGLFNHGYRNTDVYYRDPDRNASFRNTIGPHLYQLTWYDRPFIQWPVFAEYQNLKDVTGWTLYAKGKLRLDYGFQLLGTLDLNYIVPENSEDFLYPFYDIGLGWEPYPNMLMALGATNKGMNLDKHYPTFYLFNRPVPSIRFRWGLGEEIY